MIRKHFNKFKRVAYLFLIYLCMLLILVQLIVFICVLHYIYYVILSITLKQTRTFVGTRPFMFLRKQTNIDMHDDAYFFLSIIFWTTSYK